MILAGCGGNAEQADVGAASIIAHPGKEIYDQYCYSCHNPGLNGAPRLGDAEAWAPRIAQGRAILLTSTLEGIAPAMPQRGLCLSCSDDDLAAAVDYMIEEGQ
ncbi:MAG: cytochrome c5 family protein [Gammaproteobacteria bacterium]|jgi:cytochrome c5|nr:cytochrome c5 family protein [Gammaproteobacteria bacterium]